MWPTEALDDALWSIITQPDSHYSNFGDMSVSLEKQQFRKHRKNVVRSNAGGNALMVDIVTAEGTLIGCIGFSSVNRKTGFANWGLVILKNHWSVPLSVEFFNFFCMFGFVELGLLKILSSAMRQSNIQELLIRVGCQLTQYEENGISTSHTWIHYYLSNPAARSTASVNSFGTAENISSDTNAAVDIQHVVANCNVEPLKVRQAIPDAKLHHPSSALLFQEPSCGHTSTFSGCFPENDFGSDIHSNGTECSKMTYTSALTDNSCCSNNRVVSLCCKDCRQHFNFVPHEQRFFEQKGYAVPVRCLECRTRKRSILLAARCTNSSDGYRTSPINAPVDLAAAADGHPTVATTTQSRSDIVGGSTAEECCTSEGDKVTDGNNLSLSCAPPIVNPHPTCVADIPPPGYMLKAHNICYYWFRGRECRVRSCLCAHELSPSFEQDYRQYVNIIQCNGDANRNRQGDACHQVPVNASHMAFAPPSFTNTNSQCPRYPLVSSASPMLPPPRIGGAFHCCPPSDGLSYPAVPVAVAGPVPMGLMVYPASNKLSYPVPYAGNSVLHSGMSGMWSTMSAPMGFAPMPTTIGTPYPVAESNVLY